LNQRGVNVFPILPTADAQVGGFLDTGFFRLILADAPGILLVLVGFEALNHFPAKVIRQCVIDRVYKGQRLDFVHGDARGEWRFVIVEYT
jgi:hypothetical protein